MPPSRLRGITRERRRVALVAFCVLAGVMLARGPGGGVVGPICAAVAAGLAVGALALVRPSLRGYGEAAGLASLALGGLVHVRPGGMTDPGAQDGTLLGAALVWIALVMLLRRGRRALGATPLPRRRNLRLKTRATSTLSLQQLWHGLVPSAQETPSGLSPDYAAIADMSLRLGRVRLMSQPASDLAFGPRLQILEVEPPYHIRLRSGGQDPGAVIGASGESEIFLVDLGSTRLVLFRHVFTELPLGRALLAWLDDAPGRLLDRRLDEIERAEREDRIRHTSPTRIPPVARAAEVRDAAIRSDMVAAWDADAVRDSGAANAAHRPDFGPARPDRRAS